MRFNLNFGQYQPFMKKSHIRIVSILFCLTFSFTKINAQTVYIAETGKKYHTKNCPALKSGKKEIQLKEARKKGYEACTNCGAEKILLKEEKKGVGRNDTEN